MVAIQVPNTTEEEDGPAVPPVHEDGTPYRYEMLFNGMVDRAYADTATELLACIIPRYGSMTEGERLAARLSHATRSQTTVQADINWQHNNLVGCTTPEEEVILTSSRANPPEITTWSCIVPIILVDVYYEPLGSLPQPVSSFADVKNPPNIFWLRVQDETEYLLSLCVIGLVEVNQHADAD